MRKIVDNINPGIVDQETFEEIKDALSRASTVFGIDKILGKKMLKAKYKLENMKDKYDKEIILLRARNEELERIIANIDKSYEGFETEDGNIIENIDKRSRVDVVFGYGNSPSTGNRTLYMGINTNNSSILFPLEKDSNKVKEIEKKEQGRLSMDLIIEYRKIIMDRLNKYFLSIGRGKETPKQKRDRF